MISEHRLNRLGCYAMVVILLAILAVAAWLSFGMQSKPETRPAAANLSAPSDPTAGS